MTKSRSRRWGGSTLIVVSLVGGTAVVGTVALVLRNVASTPSREALGDEFTVTRGSFEISVPASGELAALNQIEIRNRLEYRAVLTELIDEGTTVKKGDILFQVADDEVLDKIKDAEDTVNSAVAAHIAAESNVQIKTSAAESEIDRADLDVMLAELAFKAWKEGEDVSKRNELALDIETADINYKRLVDRYEESKNLVAQEFISQDEFKQDEISMIEARARLDQANLDKRIYEEYEAERQFKQKQSDVEQALSERERVRERHKAELQTARADLASKVHRLHSRRTRLAELKEQLEFCVVPAPSDGLVVYASSLGQHRWSRMDTGDLQAGNEIRRNELVMILPDISQMTAKVKVSESHSGLIEPGQRAVITSDAVPDVALEGEVLSIGVLAESGGWRDPNRRDYTVEILLTTGYDLGLKPSMRCKADIYVGRVDDAVHVPLQAVFRNGPTAFVYVPQGAGFAQRPVELGEASTLYMQVTEGLAPGETVLLREPRPREIVARIEQASSMQGQAALGSASSSPSEGKRPQSRGKGRPSQAQGKGQRSGNGRRRPGATKGST